MPRLEFTSPIKREAFERSQGICECHLIPFLNRPLGCGVKLGSGNTFYEHVVPNAIRPDNSLENCAALSKTCWREKTAGYDLPTIADSNRARDRERGIKPQHYQPMVGTRRSGIKLPMRPYSDPIDRRTGQPWRGR